MKRKLTALLAALCITAVLPVHAGAVDLPLTSRAAVLMEKTTDRCCSPKTSMRSWSRPASPRS